MKPIQFWSRGRTAGDQVQGLLADGREQSGAVDQRHRGEFSVRNTSAGEASPSWTSWFASSRSLAAAELHLDPGLILEERGNLLE